jgi:periplasmic protein TonB
MALITVLRAAGYLPEKAPAIWGACARVMTIVRWACAAAVVCSLHVGGVMLALMHSPEEEADVASAVTVELAAPLPAPVRVDSPDLLHGPKQKEAKSTRQASKQVLEKDIPLVDPSPAPEPEVALLRPQLEEKEKPEHAKTQEAFLENERPQKDRERLATAPPRAAPSVGQSAALAPVKATWRDALIRHLERSVDYPETARFLGQQGKVHVRFRVDRSGHVISSHIVKSAGARRLDREVLALLARADPMPVPPDQLPDSDLELDVPVNFMIKNSQ